MPSAVMTQREFHELAMSGPTLVVKYFREWLVVRGFDPNKPITLSFGMIGQVPDGTIWVQQ